ncbi:hypothetical protein IFM89_012418 [Coptis chinensis]|uniref:FAS1 domain-containing protein n=1 Tax=Coptis chinensis TaxID=261450 RepID=A0A835M009_9MAGN|nr:hypothetical protein IFM89_012418 [Coptis chinensis]
MATSSLICLAFFLLVSSASCFNITRLLGTYPDYSTFNDYLTQTKLNVEINRRRTITVLAVANDQMGRISGSNDVIKKIMSLHVVLDYFDEAKLTKLSKKTAILTTLFQSSGEALSQQGFVNVTDLSTGEVVFGPAAKGSRLDSKFVKKVAAQPFNISVIEISSPIIPSGIGTVNVSPTPAPRKAPTVVPSVSPNASPPSSEAPTADEPTADSPTDAPISDTPLASPPSPVADEPVADDAPAPSAKKSSGARVTLGMCATIVMVAISSWVAL